MKSQDTEAEKDPFLCTCGPCKRFWRNSFQGVSSSLQSHPRSRAVGTSSLATHQSIMKYGDRVMVKGKHPGAVRFVGFLDDQAIAPKLYIGVKLDDNVNSLHNGMHNGKRFFNCPPGHGAMVTVNEIKPLATLNPRPPVTGNKMYPSFKEVRQRRKEREEKLAKLYSDAQVSKKHYSTRPARTPKISPRPTKTTQLRNSSAPPGIMCRDPHDIAFKDEQMREKKKLALLEATLESPEEQQMRQWCRGFGGKEQGERMASTLQKLHHAYQEGLSMTQRRPSSGSSSDT